MRRKTIIFFGRIPPPFGGVTVFCGRVIAKYSNKIDFFVDLYPIESLSEYKLNNSQIEILKRYNLRCTIKIIYLLIFKSNKTVFWNFSSPRALYLFLFIPKFNKTSWQLTLHHGQLGIGSKFPQIFRFVLNKFDVIRYLSVKQLDFYKSISSSSIYNRKLKSGSSYIEYCNALDLDIQNLYKELRSKYSRVFVTSGPPRKNFNISELISYFNDKPDCVLLIFLYADGSEAEYIEELANGCENCVILRDKAEQYFISVLSVSDCFVRAASVDSFGISCYDALQVGCDVIASSACKRYQNLIVYGNTLDELYSCLDIYISDADLDQFRIDSNHDIPIFELDEV